MRSLRKLAKQSLYDVGHHLAAVADPKQQADERAVGLVQREKLVAYLPRAGEDVDATGKLQTDAANEVGFDIYSTVVSNGWTVRNQPFASFGGSFYRINVITGKATALGSFRVPVVDIAIPLDQ